MLIETVDYNLVSGFDNYNGSGNSKSSISNSINEINNCSIFTLSCGITISLFTPLKIKMRQNSFKIFKGVNANGNLAGVSNMDIKCDTMRILDKRHFRIYSVSSLPSTIKVIWNSSNCGSLYCYIS